MDEKPIKCMENMMDGRRNRRMNKWIHISVKRQINIGQLYIQVDERMNKIYDEWMQLLDKKEKTEMF